MSGWMGNLLRCRYCHFHRGTNGLITGATVNATMILAKQRQFGICLTALLLLLALPPDYLHLYDTVMASDWDDDSTNKNADWIRANDVAYDGPTYVNQGDTFNISCQMSRFQAPQWTLNDRPIEKDDGGDGDKVKYRIGGEGMEMSREETIIIQNVNERDEGFYRCNSFSRNAHFVNVLTQHDNRPKHAVASDSRTAAKVFQVLEHENRRIKIDCKLGLKNPNATVYWSKEGIYIEPDRRRYREGAKLVIENANSDQDAGQYLCRTDNMPAEGSVKFGQIIELRASIKVRPFKQSVLYRVQGQSAKLHCQYSGYPRGTITWIIGNNRMSKQELKSKDIRLVQSKQPNDVLVIDKLRMEHSGMYTCLVNNSLTAGEQSALIKVRENQVYISGPHTLLEGRELRISCNVTEYLQQDPEWYKDTTIVSKLPDYGDRIRTETLGSKEWQLVFANAIPSDVGNYSCVHNKLNATTRVRTVPILYQFEEFQKTNYKSANIVEGERFSLRCALAKGYERDAHLQWYKYREEDASSDHLAAHLLTINTSDARISIESNDSISSVLTISEVGPQDRFFYVCKSHNSVTSYNNTILLRIKDKLAALWPFLGIVCEVLILCIVIFVYEKRRVKPDFDDTPTTNHRKNEGKGSPQDSSSRSQDVRQRK